MFDTILKLFSYSLINTFLALAMILLIKAFYIVGKATRYNMLMLSDTLTIILMTFIASFRYGFGSDYFQYLGLSEAYPKIFPNIKYLFQGSVIREYAYQIGFPLLSVVSNKIFNNKYAIFFVVACIIYIPLLLYVRKKSPCVFYSLCVYIFFGLWGFSLNILKQAIAMIFICFAYEALKKKKIISYIMLCLCGVIFHSTALLAGLGLIVALFIKPTFKSLNICIIAGVVLRSAATIAIRFLTRFSVFSRYYKRYYDGTTIGIDRTFVPIGVIIETLFVLYILYLAIKDRRLLRNVVPDIDTYISIVMISIPFSILGISRVLWLANRFAKFFLQFLIILVPTLMIQNKEAVKNRPLLIKLDRTFVILLMLFVWHFLYSSLMLDNNSFTIDFLFFQ